MPVKSLIRTIPGFPRQGIQFRDITPLLGDPEGLRLASEAFLERYRDRGIRKVAAIEARGFILGAILAHGLGAGFVPIRKKGKLPGETIGQDYALEYGTDRLEAQVDAITPGDRVLLVDDLLATGGTAEAAALLLWRLGGEILETTFIVELPDLGGRRRLEGHGHGVFALVEFSGE